jgi:hypothetical protein
VDAIGYLDRTGCPCDALPTAALLDSQSLRGAETVGKSSRGYDAGRR